MHLTKNITVELSEDDIKEILVEYVRNTFKHVNCDVKDVTIKVERELQGYGLGEYHVCVCKGASVKCEFE